MSIKKKHFVTFLSPGTLFSEESDKPISKWDTVEAMKMASKITERYGAKPYAFKFETRVVSDPIEDGFGGSLKVIPKTIKESGLYYINGEIYSIDDVFKRNLPEESILRSNMEINGLWYIVETRNSWRHTGTFEEKDFVVDVNGVITHQGNNPEYVKFRETKNKEKEKKDKELEEEYRKKYANSTYG